MLIAETCKDNASYIQTMRIVKARAVIMMSRRFADMQGFRIMDIHILPIVLYMERSFPT